MSMTQQTNVQETDWYKARPAKVQARIDAYPPTKLYRDKQNGRVVPLYSYEAGERMMLELPLYAASLHPPVTSMEELCVAFQAALQAIVDVFAQVAQVIDKALQSFIDVWRTDVWRTDVWRTVTRSHRSQQERHFLAVIRKSEQRKHHVVRAKRRSTYPTSYKRTDKTV